MVKGEAQVFEPGVKLSPAQLKDQPEANFAVKETSEEVSIIEKISDKFDVKVRFARLRKRMRNRPSNIL